ncbi:MAG TPA: zf-HC2 domain-containing protein [Gemmatimonadota bacterium]|nr:zf-HC2 domain-containing protein [Gemmatimonadota bacterium]
MPHINEGLLHAQLDGALGPDEQLQWAEAEAHLEVCEDCRRRRDEAADLRGAARDLLAAAGPAAPAGRPAFDELVDRARLRRAEPASGRKSSAGTGAAWWRTPARLGWAASLVIAVGAGWIGRQLVVEQGFDAPEVATEQEAPMGRTGRGEGADLEDAREDGRAREARARRDAAAAAAAPEAEAEAEPRQEARPEDEGLQDKAQPITDAAAEAEPSEFGADDAIRVQEIAPLAAASRATSGARCYEASPAAGDGRAAAAGKPETLRLAPDGTATLRLDGRPLVGFWERTGADSLRLRVTDGEGWRELVLVEAANGVRGDAELETVDCP